MAMRSDPGTARGGQRQNQSAYAEVTAPAACCRGTIGRCKFEPIYALQIEQIAPEKAPVIRRRCLYG